METGTDISSVGGGAKCQNCLRKQEEIDKLRTELDEWQNRCRLVEEENERQKNELRSLESEMEEMHDNFKEEESEQFEQIKQELDVALKNYKILQIKLNKSERQYSQLEQVKTMLERQLLQESKARQQQQQSSSPQQQDDYDQQRMLRNNSHEEQQRQLFEMSPNQDFVKLPAREYDQLLRDLNDTSERERDLQEQIKYSQEEAQLKGERLQAVEAENEVLLGRISKLTNANSGLRSTLLSHQRLSGANSSSVSDAGADQQQQQQQQQNRQDGKQQLRELVEQNEQLNLALELAQAEGARLRQRQQELQAQVAELKEAKMAPDNDEQTSLPRRRQEGESCGNHAREAANHSFELECRQLRARLVQYEREQRQLRSHLESMGQSWPGATLGTGQSSFELRSCSREELEECKSSKCQSRIRQLSEQCEILGRRARESEHRPPRADDSSQLESDLLEKLKRQLDVSESELARARSRLVELDIECSKAQRQYKRLLDSYESCGSGEDLQVVAARRLKLPSESMREAMSRADLRQALRDLECDLEEMATMVKAKDCLMREQQEELVQLRRQPQQQQHESIEEQQVKSLRRLLDQERLLSNNLKLDVANLERECNELRTRKQMLERERAAMEEELDRLRKFVGELRAELEEHQQGALSSQARARDLAETVEKLRAELAESQKAAALVPAGPGQRHPTNGSGAAPQPPSGPSASNNELLMMARDLSELKVKNGFLMRQLEMARDHSQRQLDELKEAHELQQRRAVEMAQLELKERHLAVEQQLKEEANEFKQKVASLQRQVQRHDEELAGERDRARAIERDWRRDKSQWQQAREQLEGQLSIEKRSSEFKLREAEVAARDKERACISLQDKCVQLERDLKRSQNKYQLLEEDCDCRVKSLSRELEFKSRELLEASSKLQASESQNYSQLRKLTEDNKTLGETLGSLRQAYESKVEEAKQLGAMLRSRQEQSYKERQQSAEQVADLARRLNEAQENETQAKLLRQRLEIQERQLESARRDLTQSRDERARLRSRCEELEKRELITKTSTISSSHSSSFLRPFVGHTRPTGGESPAKRQQQSAPDTGEHKQHLAALNGGQGEQVQTIERLSGKINDQRNLIQMLRQQLSETQLELKQMKLLQASERSRWQTRVAILTSRLNECEEKLAFEMTSSLALNNQQADSSFLNKTLKAHLESQFEIERQANLELIQQQQTQIDSLARDLKKMSQAHDMLRLHCKQLESNNNKLSKKLIEYQQQQPLANLAQQELESRHERLTKTNARLRAEVKPLVEIVSKMVASLDAPEQQQQQPKTNDSTKRPLRAPAAAADQRLLARQESNNDDETLDTHARTMAQAVPNQSRLSRLFAGGRSPAAGAASGQRSARLATTSPEMDDNDEDEGCASAARKASSAGAGRKATKRVRIKCSSLGITTGEKKQLKQQLKILSQVLQEQQTSVTNSTVSSAIGSSQHTSAHASGKATGDSHQDEHSTTSPVSAGGGAVRWQKPFTFNRTDSDLDSERSWSLEPNSHSSGPQKQRADSYRRFPQATPSAPHQPLGGGAAQRASFTDYESESSLASDYFLGNGGGGGAESDSGISPGGRQFGRNKAKQRAGIRGRVASTLRTISRSIQGLASAPTSDAEGDNTCRKEAKNLREIAV